MKGKIYLGWVLLLVGSLLLATTALVKFWVPGQVLQVPKNVNSVTRLEGMVDKLNPATGKYETGMPVRVTSVTKVDPKASDDDVVAWVNTTCVNIDRDNPADCLKGTDERVVSNSIDVFATDRTTAVAVNGDKYLPPTAEPKEGLVNKWPFEAKKKDYQYWDGLLKKTVTAKYEETLDMDGLEIYKYHVSTPATAAEVADGIQGTYASDKVMLVEPLTGSIVNQIQDEQRTLEDGTKVLNLHIEFTKPQVAAGIKDGKANVARLNTILNQAPAWAGIGGLVLFLAGLALVVRAAKQRKALEAEEEDQPTSRVTLTK